MKFGHHPDPATDFSIEVDTIEAELVDRTAGLAPTMDLGKRIGAAMQFTVGGSPAAIVAKTELRLISAAFNAGQAPTHAPDGDAEYQSWNAVLRAELGPELPACNICGGTGIHRQDEIDYVCECGGCGVQMDRNEPYTGQRGWKLHRCPDSEQCRAQVGGGCASGWCEHFLVRPEHRYVNIAAARG